MIQHLRSEICRTFFAVLFAGTALAPAFAAAPSIVWTNATGSGSTAFSGPINPTVVAPGQTYMVRAQGTDADGNLTAVSIDKNNRPFAYAGGGNGSAYISNNPSTDSSGPVVFTAWAQDASGNKSAVITLTVNINAPPTISWTSAGGAGASAFSGPINPQTVNPNVQYMIRAQGVDSNGNLSAVSINKNGAPFAYAGGGDGSSYISNNATSDPSGAITYTAWATDAAGASSGQISWTVNVSSPPPAGPVSASITTSQTSGSWPLSPTITWSSTNATSVSVSGPGLTSTAASGSQGMANLAPGNYTYSITAQGSQGPATSYCTVNVSAPRGTGGLAYPRNKFVGAYYESWFTGSQWDGAWAGNGVTPTSLGRYISNAATGKAHANRLKALGVDFVAIDNCNNTIWGPLHPQSAWKSDYIFENAKAVISGFDNDTIKAVILLSIGNARGGEGNDKDTEQLLTQNIGSGATMYYTNIPTNTGDLFRAKVARVYNELAEAPDMKNKYFRYEGKPLLLLYTTASGAIYDASGVNRTPNGKLEGADLAINIPGVGDGSKSLTDLFTIRWVGAYVSRSGNSAYVASPDQTIAKNGHWSWEDGCPQSWARQPTGWLSDVFPESVSVSAFSREYGPAGALVPLAGRAGGATFRSQWNRAWEVDPVITMVHTWNEFSAGDEWSAEYSQSIEANNWTGDVYETYLSSYSSFFRTLRYDVGLYDTSLGLFRLYNRKADYQAPTSTDFGFETDITAYRGSSVQTLSGDFDHDGLFEIGLRNTSDGTVALRFSPRFTVAPSGDSHAEVVVALDAGANWQIFAADVNGDGYCDLGLFDTTTKQWKFYVNDHSYGFRYDHFFSWDPGAGTQVACADINSDGSPDLLVRDTSSGTITIGLDNSAGLQSAPNRIYTVSRPGGAHYQLFAADFSQDGAAELGLRDSSTGQFYFWQNNRAVTGTQWSFGAQSSFFGPAGAHLLPVVGDFR